MFGEMDDGIDIRLQNILLLQLNMEFLKVRLRSHDVQEDR